VYIPSGRLVGRHVHGVYPSLGRKGGLLRREGPFLLREEGGLLRRGLFLLREEGGLLRRVLLVLPEVCR